MQERQNIERAFKSVVQVTKNLTKQITNEIKHIIKNEEVIRRDSPYE